MDEFSARIYKISIWNAVHELSQAGSHNTLVMFVLGYPLNFKPKNIGSNKHYRLLNRSTIYNGPYARDLLYPHPKSLMCPSKISTTGFVHQTTSNRDSLFTCNVSLTFVLNPV